MGNNVRVELEKPPHTIDIKKIRPYLGKNLAQRVKDNLKTRPKD